MRQLQRRIHALWLALLRAHASPSRLALAVWLGVIVGCTPLFGLHLPLCIALAWVCGLNQIAVYAAANVSIPPFAPVLGFASVQLGMRILEGRWFGLSLAVFRERPLGESAKAFFTAWMLGGVLLGTALGAVMAAFSYLFLRNKKPKNAALQAAALRYAQLPPKYRIYAACKYRLDPVYERIGELVPPHSHTVDFGAGLNMLAAYLAALGGSRRATGLEWDAQKVAAARLAAPELSIVHADVRTLHAVAPADVVTIVDMLHYFDEGDRARILQTARELLRSGGLLLVRENVSSAWTRLLERIAVKTSWNQAPGIQFLNEAALVQRLETLGFSVQVRELAGPLHPGNVLYVCRKL